MKTAFNQRKIAAPPKPAPLAKPASVLQQKADASLSVQKLMQLKAVTGCAMSARGTVLQRAPLTLLASYSGGKIGSIYFSDSRIRGPHPTGPKEFANKDPSGEKTYRFNIELSDALKEYQAKDENYLRIAQSKVIDLPPEKQPAALQTELWRAVRGDVAKDLHGKSKGELPKWATLVETVEDAPDFETASAKGLKLLEVFENADESFGGMHASRGFAATLETSTEEIVLLREALDKSKAGADFSEKNKIFYDFLSARNEALAAKFNQV